MIIGTLTMKGHALIFCVAASAYLAMERPL